MSGLLRKLIFKGFQKWRDRTFEFGPGVNLIVAVSDSGKTSIMRGVYWVMFNRPMGLDSIRYDPELAKDGGKELSKADMTSVEMVFDDGWVRRERNGADGDKGVNRYVLSCHPDPLEALNGHVPEEVRRFLNLDPEFSIQMQHDQYFLIQWTSGKVAEWINSVSGLSIIDRSSSAIKSIADEARREVKASSSRISELEVRGKELERYKPAGPILESLDSAVSDKEKARKEAAALNGVADLLTDVEENLGGLGEWLKVDVPFSALQGALGVLFLTEEEKGRISIVLAGLRDAEDRLARVGRVVLADASRTRLGGLLEEHQKTTLEADGLSSLTDSLAEVELRISSLDELASGGERVNGLLDRITGMRALGVQGGGIARILSQLEDAGRRTGELEQLITVAAARYALAIREVGLCPTCGTKVDPNDVRSIREHAEGGC